MMNLTIDITGWKLRQYRDFIAATKTGDFDVLIEVLSKLITSWDFAGDPKNTDYWLDELTVTDWQNIQKRFTELLTEKFSIKN